MQRCPSCGAEMEEGFLGVETNELTPPSWFKKKSLTGSGGEKIGSRWSLSGLTYMEADRCMACRKIIIDY